MKVAQATGPTVRLARAEEIAGAGALTAEAYLADRLLDEDDEYEAQLRDAIAASPRGDAAGRDRPVRGVRRQRDGRRDGDARPVRHRATPRSPSRASSRCGCSRSLRAPADAGSPRRSCGPRSGTRSRPVPGGWCCRRSTRWSPRTGSTRGSGSSACPERDWGHEYVHLRVQTWTPPEAPGCARGVADLAAAAGRRGGRLAGRHLGRADATRATVRCSTGAPTDPVAALDRVEQVYADAGLPSVVRAPRPHGAGCAPSGSCDEWLRCSTRAGTRPSRRRTCWCARSSASPPLPDRLDLPGVQITVRDEPDDAWLALWLGAKDDTADRATGRAILTGAPGALPVDDVHLRHDARSRSSGSRSSTTGRRCRASSCDGSARRRGLARALTLRALHEASRARCTAHVPAGRGAQRGRRGALLGSRVPARGPVHLPGAGAPLTVGAAAPSRAAQSSPRSMIVRTGGSSRSASW